MNEINIRVQISAKTTWKLRGNWSFSQEYYMVYTTREVFVSRINAYHIYYKQSFWLIKDIKIEMMNSMKQSLSWECNRRSDTEEISRTLWNPKFHQRVQKSSPLVHIMRYESSSHTHSLFIRIHFNNILPSMPKSSKWSHPFSFPNKTFTCSSFNRACYIHPSHSL